MQIGQLLLNYDTDKNRGKTEKKNGHYYGDTYQEIFNNFDKESYLNIMEVGVQKGGSLLAWKDYFINSFVVGVDIIDDRLEEYIRNDVNFILSDCNDPLLKKDSLLSNRMFDLIIDDGSHYLNDVCNFLFNFLPILNINGYYIVEDVQSPGQWDSSIESIVNTCNFGKFEIRSVDLRNINGYYDDYLIIIKRIN